jgi:hypothetical protein
MIIEEIERAQRSVKTDAYQMSVGEIVNMYKEGELVINPDFQRLFRWEIGQKSRFIESLLLGIPTPSIFVFEKEDSKWELVDGLQRISTLLEFMGLLKSPESNDLQLPSVLVGTKYLPSLNNVVWEQSQAHLEVDVQVQRPIERSLQLAIRRSRITVEILKRPSNNNTKYDLFQRLNAGGMPANPQELRNCIVIMANTQYFQYMKQLAANADFKVVIAASDEQIVKQRLMEYVSRFLVYTYIPYNGVLDVEEYIDQGIIELAGQNETSSSGACFTDVFRILNALSGDNALRRIIGGSPSGRVGLVAFECIAIGIAKNIVTIRSKTDPNAYVGEKIREFWSSSDSAPFFTLGTRGTTRIQRTILFGESWFAK